MTQLEMQTEQAAGSLRASRRCEASGDVVFVRGMNVKDDAIQPTDWRERLANHLKSIPGAGVVGAKR
ncbi:MAG TPA: hypothetical protein VG711_03125, partial [Phycisphaerales bacterium]|nr:hypothetical protein [Phycisphaerales bacterium]